MARTIFPHQTYCVTKDALHLRGVFLACIAFVENCKNMVYYLSKCGVFWMVCVGEKQYGEKRTKENR